MQEIKKELEVGSSSPVTTNNQMELMAAIHALKLGLCPEAHASLHVTKVQVFTDSQYVRNGIETWIHGWKRNGWRTSAKQPVKNVDLWRKLDQLRAQFGHGLSLQWHWVRGHSGHPQNEQVDRLARHYAETQKPGNALCVLLNTVE